MVCGVCAGVLALAGLVVVHADARALFHGLTRDGGAAMVAVSAAAGLATLALVWRGHFGPARGFAAVAVAAIVVGWALAQRPVLLPGLTVEQAAAGRATLIAVVIAVVAGAAMLGPSLILLFRLLLRNRLHAAGIPAPRASHCHRWPAGPDAACSPGWPPQHCSPGRA
jgi:cytochrome bd-type quinol oxidase subunit 2